MTKSKTFDGGRFNYSIDYRQFVEVNEDGEHVLMHKEVARYYQFPFTFGVDTQVERCLDTAEYYRS